MRISDWSSDVCSSDLPGPFVAGAEKAIISVRFIEDIAGAVTFDRAGRPIRVKGKISVYPPHQQGILRFADRHGAHVRAGAGIMNVIGRSGERRGGKEGVSTWDSRWLPDN